MKKNSANPPPCMRYKKRQRFSFTKKFRLQITTRGHGKLHEKFLFWQTAKCGSVLFFRNKLFCKLKNAGVFLSFAGMT